MNDATRDIKFIKSALDAYNELDGMISTAFSTYIEHRHPDLPRNARYDGIDEMNLESEALTIKYYHWCGDSYETGAFDISFEKLLPENQFMIEEECKAATIAKVEEATRKAERDAAEKLERERKIYEELKNKFEK